MALLQIMMHDSDEVQGELIHVVDEVHLGAEYTACGLAIPDSTLNYEGVEYVGESFRGSLKKCTCSACLKTINYYKSLR